LPSGSPRPTAVT